MTEHESQRQTESVFAVVCPPSRSSFVSVTFTVREETIGPVLLAEWAPFTRRACLKHLIFVAGFKVSKLYQFPNLDVL